MGRTSDAKQRLINSAIKLISNRSYSSVGVQELCDDAEVKKGSFYHFFDSKKELTLISMDEIWDHFKSNIIEPLIEMDATLDDKFSIFLDSSYQLQLHDKKTCGCILGCPFGNLALEMSTQDEEIRRKVESIFEDWICSFEKLILKAIERGEIPQNVDPRSTAESVVAYLEGLSLIGKAYNNPDILRRLGCVVRSISVCCEEQNLM